MIAVILTIHTLIVLGLIVVVLLQRSDGGALGLGGGGGGGFMSGRGAANALTRTTSILAALFFATSLGLAIYAGAGEDEDAVIEGLTGEAPATSEEDAFSVPSTDDLLQNLGGDTGASAGDDNAADAPLTEQEILDNLGAEAEVEEVVEDAALETPSDQDSNAPDE